MTGRSRRAPLALLAVGAIAVGAVWYIAFVQARGGYEPDGPLASERRTSIATRQAVGTSMTWGTVMPMNPTNQDIVLESIELSEPARGLTVIGLGVSDPRAGAVGTADGYPPTGVEPREVSGTVLSPATGPSPFVQLVIGVRLDAPEGGSISGLRIRYSVGSRRYETVLSDALVVSP